MPRMFSEKQRFEIKGDTQRKLILIDHTGESIILMDKEAFKDLLDAMGTFQREFV